MPKCERCGCEINDKDETHDNNPQYHTLMGCFAALRAQNESLAAYIKQLDAVREPARQANVFLKKWRDQGECDCPMEGGVHICGLPIMVIVIDKLDEALVGIPAKKKHEPKETSESQ